MRSSYLHISALLLKLTSENRKINYKYTDNLWQLKQKRSTKNTSNIK